MTTRTTGNRNTSTAASDDRRNAAQRGYNRRWRKARETFLRRNPLCAKCSELGRIRKATVVDHKRPHKGDQSLFWDTTNWQALCKRCHDSTKQMEEHGRIIGCNVDGTPLDPSHHWHR